jgi:hypothetical protein
MRVSRSEVAPSVSPAFTVKPGDEIREVAMHMAKHELESALVVELSWLGGPLEQLLVASD